MNRNDWIFVGVRLIGLYVLVTALPSALGVVLSIVMPQVEAQLNHSSSVVLAATGGFMFFATAKIELWLGRLDASGSQPNKAMLTDAAAPRR